MRKKINVFYVWGYGGSPESNNIKYLQDALGNEYNVVSDYYAQYNPEEAIKDINYYIKKYKIDILVGSSLGGYITLQIPNIKRVIINPCLYPNIELPLLKDEDGEPSVPEHINEFYSKYINEHNVWENNSDDIIFIMGEDDELFGTKYVDEIKEHSQNVYLVKQGHHNTQESITTFVAPQIKELTI